MAKHYDWEPIEAAYRTGKYSNRQLSQLYGPSETMIRRNAKDGGWLKDLSKPVSARVKDKITAQPAEEVKAQEATSKGIEVEAMSRPTDEEIIEAAANTAASIVFHHRAYAQKGREIAGRVFDTLIKEMDAGTMPVAEGGEVIEEGITMDYVTKNLNAATMALERIVKIERQAFRLDDEDQDENPNADLTDEELDRRINELLHKES